MAPLQYGGAPAPATAPASSAVPGPGATGGNHLAPVSGFLSTSGHLGGTYRVRHVVEGAELVDPALVYANLRRLSNRLQPGPNPITVRCSIELPGVPTPVPLFTATGARDVVLAPGQTATFRAHRGAGVRLPAGAVFYTRTHVTVAASGEQWPVGRTTQTAAGEGNNSSATPTDLTTTGTVPQAFAFAFSPVAVIGARTAGQRPSVGLVGDSIVTGQGDVPNDQGYAIRALAAAAAPWVRVSCPGERAADFAADPWLRTPLLQGVDAVLCHYGRNDLTGGRTLAQVQADLLTCWRTLAAYAPVHQGTVTPQTTTTDAYVSTANQTTVASEPVRVQLNTWLRAGAPLSAGAPAAVGTAGALLAGQPGHPLRGVLELADTVESARNSGLWKPGLTSDGIHPLPAGHALLAAAVDPAQLR